MKQTEKTELTVSKIIDAATKEFGEKGYAKGTVNGICKSGINKGLVYHNFKDRDEIYLACLRRCCNTFVSLAEESGADTDILKYMKFRLSFHKEHPCEAHVLFEAVLQPYKKIYNRTSDILCPFRELNEKVYLSAISSLHLRNGVTEEDALEYFRLMQHMFNGYYSKNNTGQMTLDKQIESHESHLPKLLDFMLYGIAEEVK